MRVNRAITIITLDLHTYNVMDIKKLLEKRVTELTQKEHFVSLNSYKIRM